MRVEPFTKSELSSTTKWQLDEAFFQVGSRACAIVRGFVFRAQALFSGSGTIVEHGLYLGRGLIYFGSGSLGLDSIFS